jgi:hypothetical protein
MPIHASITPPHFTRVLLLAGKFVFSPSEYLTGAFLDLIVSVYSHIYQVPETWAFFASSPELFTLALLPRTSLANAMSMAIAMNTMAAT